MATPAAADTPAAPADPPPPLRGGALVLGTLALSMAVFMNVLDSSIANVSVPVISGNLGVSPQQGTWVITSFAVSNAISVPLTGWLTKRFGQVRMFLWATFLFMLASFLCGISPNIQMLIAARVLQGAVAGPMIPLSQALLLASNPPEKRGSALAIWSMTILVAPVMGPMLGGWITDTLSWPWIFYINLPVGIFALWGTWTVYHKRETPTARLPIDGLGLVLLVTWVGAMQLMLDKGKELDWFRSWEIIALAVVAVLAFLYFLIWELTEDHPVVDLHLFRSVNFTGGVIAISVAFAFYFGALVLIPLWLQTQLGYTASEAGLVMAPVGLLAIVLSPITGKLVGKVDARFLSSVALLIFAWAFYMRSHFTPDVDQWSVIVPTLIQGAGVAFFFLPLNAIIMSDQPPHKIPDAAGVSNFVRIMFGGIGTSLTTTWWDTRTALHHARLAEATGAHNPAFTQGLQSYAAQGVPEPAALALIERRITVEASTQAVTDLFWLMALLFVVLALLIWLTHKPHGLRTGGAGRPAASVESEGAGGAH